MNCDTEEAQDLINSMEDITERECHFSSTESKVNPTVCKLFFLSGIISILGVSISISNQNPIFKMSSSSLEDNGLDMLYCSSQLSENDVITTEKVVVSQFRNGFYSTSCQSEFTGKKICFLEKNKNKNNFFKKAAFLVLLRHMSSLPLFC